MRWNGINTISPKSYFCGYCNDKIASEKGWMTINSALKIYICPSCYKPTLFDHEDTQSPGILIGNEIQDIDDQNIINLYSEARRCFSVNAFTSVVLSCRKILMHVSVAKGADENKTFLEYVKFLADRHYIPTGSEGWVDKIRNKGNEANHEISIMSEAEAKELLILVEMLLKIIYEFPPKATT